MKCPACQFENADNATQCAQCGLAASASIMKAPKPQSNYANAGSWVGVIVAIIVFQLLIAPLVFPPREKSELDILQMMCAGAFALLGSTIGRVIGSHYKKQPQTLI